MNIIDNKRFTLAWHSLVAFDQARKIAQLMCKLGLKDKDPIAATLYGALVGYYTRPFMSSNNLGKLPDSIVPNGFEQLHRDTIQLRNQVFLHTDGNAQAPGKPDINYLRFTIHPDKDTIWVHNIVPIPKAETFRKLCDLLDLLIEEINAAINDYIRRKVPGTPLVPGKYVLKLDSDKIALQPER